MCLKVINKKPNMTTDSATQCNLSPKSWLSRCKSVFFKYLKISLKLLFVAFTITFVVWLSFFGYATIYYYMIPASSHVLPIHLEFNPACGSNEDGEYRGYRGNPDVNYPTAVIPLMKNSQNQLMPGILYKVSLEMELPESKVNRDLGMFSVKVFSFDHNSEPIHSSTRSAMLHYKSFFVQLLQTIFFAPSFIMGRSEEKQKINIAMFEDFTVEPFAKIEGIKVVVKSCNIQIYDVVLKIEANLSGLRYYMLHWPLISASVGIGMGQFFLFSICLLSWHKYLWPLQKRILFVNVLNKKDEEKPFIVVFCIRFVFVIMNDWDLKLVRRERASARGWLTRSSKYLDTLIGKPEVYKVDLEDAIADFDNRLNRLDKVQAIWELKIEEDMLSQEIEEAGTYREATCSFRLRGKKILAGLSDKLSARNINVRAGVSASKIDQQILAGISDKLSARNINVRAGVSASKIDQQILAGISDKLSARNINVRAGVSASKIDQQILAGIIDDRLSARNINVSAGVSVSANKIDRTEERRSRNPTVSALPSISEICCVFCSKSGHQSERCKDVQELTVKQRQDKLKFLHLCYRCLGKGHISEGCFAICSHCKGKHNILCCYEYKANNYNYNVIPSNCNSKLLGTKFSSEVQTRESEISNKVDPVNGNHDAAVFHVGVSGSTSHLCTVLQSAKVFVLGKNGPVEAPVLFDTGSDDSYVSKSLVKGVNPRWVESEGISCAAFGERGPAWHQARGVFGLEVQSRLHGYGGAHELMAVSVQNICAPLFRPKIPFELFENFKNFKLADNLEEAQELEVDTLIGLNSYWGFMTQGFVRLPEGLAAQETVFGCVISGSWKHDKFTPYRYEVALPWKENSLCKLVNNKSLALSRLNQLSKKLKNDPELESPYNKVLFEFEAAAIIGEVKVPPDKFSQWVQGFDILRKWQIPRCYNSTLIWSSIPNLELHGFGDASEKGYGAAIYLRIPCSSAYRTCLVMAKSRVAPLKQMTVPRLELMGALLVARLIMFVKNALHFSDVSIHCWSDSTIVLQWIKGHPSKWKTFIANRIYEIHELTSPDSWSHCPGENSPAALLTRGVTAQNLVDSELWLNGPIWLREKIFEHIKPEGTVQYNYLSEIVYVVHSTPGNLVHQSVFPVYRWGTFLKTIRIIGWVWRFIGNLKGLNNCGSGDLSYDDITLANLCLFKDVQFTHFNPEIHALKRDQSISKSSPIAKLTPFLGKDGLLRVKGRLDNSNLDYDSKHPIVLSKCYVTKLLVVFQHLLMKHAGVNTVLCALRNSYWITRFSKVELITLLCEIEACINSRPLTFVGDDIEDISPLTPSSFICNNSTHTNIEFSEYNTDLNLTHNNLINKYSLCEKQLNLFWSVWTHNYLRNLPPSIKKFQAKGAIEVGALVLIREDHLPRMQWPLGIVVDLYPGRDGLIRSVRIKTSKGEVNRPIQRLHSLEVNRFDNVKVDVSDPLVVHSPTRDLLERVEVVSIAKDTTSVKTPVKSRAGRVIKPVKRLGLQD
ncbi:Seipin [Nymphon striatum]|nr:Seipin [Nymphon striatum]